jgi:hypothetical protein
MPRRSARLATKPQPAYTEPVEEIDEATKKHIQAMFDVLLEESYEKVTRPTEAGHIPYRCSEQFREMFADLPEDDMERRAAEAFINRLECTHYELDLKLYNATLERLRKPKEELREKRMKLIQEEIKPFVELAIQIEKLKLKARKALKTVDTAIGSIKPSPCHGTISWQRLDLIISCIKSVDKDYLYLLSNTDKAIRSGDMKHL